MTRSACFSARAISAPWPRDNCTAFRRAASSINTGEAKGEEFPFFKTFWIEKPAAGANSIVVHALLDSESAAAAYRFTIRPGDTTVFDVEMAIYPRVDLDHAGLAPMTSMFFFGPNDRKDVEDFRPSVHDSDGLAIFNGRGEELWRPLHNPRDLQVSSFADLNPRGFGLMQRQKDFAAYQDLESNFERRPSLWAEPIGDWGEGAVKLLEIPTKEEIHDNIASFWLPKAAIAGQGRAHLHLSFALGTGCAEADLAGAIFPNRHRRARRQRHDLRARRDRREAEIGRSENPARRRDGREGQNPEHRHPAKPGDRRLAIELRAVEGKDPGRNPRIAHAGQ